jgi:hypothetical protein
MRIALAAYCNCDYIGFHFSHNEAILASEFPYGSRAFLPTLTPNLTASVPRLDTDCWSGFVRQGVSPCYMYSAELAHRNLTVD